MEIDKNKIRTINDRAEFAEMDQVEERVEARMKLIESKAKEQVAHGLQDERLAREAERLKREAERDLKSVNEGLNAKNKS